LTTENIFSIQDDISSQIVAALRARLDVELSEAQTVRVSTENLDAYDLFLQGWRLFQLRMELPQAERLLADATDLDPRYARAWEVRAAVALLRPDYGDVSMTQAEASQRALDFAETALELDPNSALALGVRAHAHATNNGYLVAPHSVAEIFAGYDRALALDSKNQSVLLWRGIQHRRVGNLEAALADFDACIEIDPDYRSCHSNQYITLHEMGRTAEAFDLYKATVRGGSAFLGGFEFGMLAAMGQETAFTILTNTPRLFAGWDRHGELYDAFHNLDADHSELVEAARRFLEDRPMVDQVYSVPSLLIPLGAYDLIRTTGIYWAYEYENYRRSPQFKNYMKQTGVLEYWRQTRFPPQCRPVGDDDFECPALPSGRDRQAGRR
jgi:tetratricopeptide (TPR) repeat protein